MTVDIECIKKEANWQPRRLAVEKSLITITILALIGLIAAILLLSGVLISNRKSDTNDKTTSSSVSKSICVTPGCVHAASRMLEKVDNSVEPCDDFYSYACGNFVKNTVIHDDSMLVETDSLNRDEYHEQLRVLISEEINPADPRPFNLARNFYKACLNQTVIEKRGLKPLTDILDSLGGWPVVLGDRWDTESTWSWTETIKMSRKIGLKLDIIFDSFVAVDLKNSTKHTIYIDNPKLNLENEFLVKGVSDHIIKAYYEFMVNVAVSLGADRSQAKRELLESLNFEIALAKISLSFLQRQNASDLYNPFTMREIQEKYPYISWVEYINALLPSGLNIDENEVIIVNVPSFFANLGKLLENTPTRTIANYMMWRTASHRYFFAISVLQNPYMVFLRTYMGSQKETPRSEYCAHITNERFKTALDAMYVRKHYRKDTKQNVAEITDGIRKEFENMLRKATWMNEQTLEAALDKLNAMEAEIGYPDELMDDKKLEHFYENLKIDPDNYLQSIFNLNIFEADYELSKLRKSINKGEWTPITWLNHINSFFWTPKNSISISVNMLRGHYFSTDRPEYLNYGAIGRLIGQLIIRSFSERGLQYDRNGNLNNWWESDTAAKYLEKTKCFIEQYSNYTEPATQLKLNGVISKEVNIADSGAVKDAYYAYQTWVRKNGPEPKLPGLDLSPQQLFWLSSAQSFCEKFRIEMRRKRLSISPYLPGQFRVVGSLMNAKEFSRDFNCPLGSPMNPVQKCEVW